MRVFALANIHEKCHPDVTPSASTLTYRRTPRSLEAWQRPISTSTGSFGWRPLQHSDHCANAKAEWSPKRDWTRGSRFVASESLLEIRKRGSGDLTNSPPPAEPPSRLSQFALAPADHHHTTTRSRLIKII